MNLKIFWSEAAKQSFRAIISQIEDRWTKREASAFVRKAFKVLDHISDNPYLYQTTQYPDVRRAV